MKTLEETVQEYEQPLRDALDGVLRNVKKHEAGREAMRSKVEKMHRQIISDESNKPILQNVIENRQAEVERIQAQLARSNSELGDSKKELNQLQSEIKKKSEKERKERKKMSVCEIEIEKCREQQDDLDQQLQQARRDGVETYSRGCWERLLAGTGKMEERLYFHRRNDRAHILVPLPIEVWEALESSKSSPAETDLAMCMVWSFSDAFHDPQHAAEFHAKNKLIYLVTQCDENFSAAPVQLEIKQPVTFVLCEMQQEYSAAVQNGKDKNA